MLWKFVQQLLRMLKATWTIRFCKLLRALFLQTLPWRHKLEAISEKITKQLWFSCTLTLCLFYWKIAKILWNLWMIYLKNHFLEFHKVVWWHISGVMDKFTTFWCNVSSTVHVWQFFWDTVYNVIIYNNCIIWSKTCTTNRANHSISSCSITWKVVSWLQMCTSLSKTWLKIRIFDQFLNWIE